jgi:regulator of cell morphogenesis and NO signaling
MRKRRGLTGGGGGLAFRYGTMSGSSPLLDPIETLMQEHQRFLERIRSFRTEVRRLTALSAPIPSLSGHVLDFAQFLDRDVTRFHGRKEEEGLFPVLGRHIPVDGGPIGVMLAEHQLLKDEQRALFQDAHRVESDPEAREAVDAIARSSMVVETVLTDHIDKEDHVLFPMARNTLSVAELTEVAEVCRQIELEYLS